MVEKALKITGQTLLFLAVLDVVILFWGLAQVAQGDNSAYWAPFWRVQAEFLINHLWSN